MKHGRDCMHTTHQESSKQATARKGERRGGGTGGEKKNRGTGGRSAQQQQQHQYTCTRPYANVQNKTYVNVFPAIDPVHNAVDDSNQSFAFDPNSTFRYNCEQKRQHKSKRHMSMCMVVCMSVSEIGFERASTPSSEHKALALATEQTERRADVRT